MAARVHPHSARSRGGFEALRDPMQQSLLDPIADFGGS
jgi:hypothetical protein